MKPNLRLLRKSRQYSDEFKKQIVTDFVSGQFIIRQLQKLYGVFNQSIYKRIYRFSTFNQKGFRDVEMKESSQQKLKELERKIKDLEATLGRKQIHVEYLEKMIEIAKTELNIEQQQTY